MDSHDLFKTLSWSLPGESEPPRKLQLVQLVTRLKFEPGISSNKIGDSAAVHRITQANR